MGKPDQNGCDLSNYLKFCENELVSIEMLIILVMGVINISRQFFSTLVGMGSRSHDFDDELKISFLSSYSVARSKTFIFGSNFCFFALMEYCVLYPEIWEG